MIDHWLNRFIALAPLSYRPALSAMRVQRRARSGRTLPLTVRYPGGGNVQHYYHFLFDLALPLERVLRGAPPLARFSVPDCGPMTRHLEEMFGEQVTCREPGQPIETAHPVDLWGLCALRIRVTAELLESFKTNMARRVGAGTGRRTGLALLIERMPPDPYYLTEQARQPGAGEGAGSSRRSLLNHAQLFAALQDRFGDAFEWRNLSLEGSSIREQIEWFDQADLVVAQHGAALANLAWMRPGSRVVEIRMDDSRRHFVRLAGDRKLHHRSLLVGDEHVQVDPDALCAEVKAVLLADQSAAR